MEDVATVWADIRFQTGSEAVRADEPVSVAKASIRIRRRSDVAADMRGLDRVRVAAITGITKANPAVVSVADHGLVSGQFVRIDDVTGMTQVNAGVFAVQRLSPDTFALAGVDSTGFSAYVGGGKSTLVVLFDIRTVLPDEESRERIDLACETGANEG